MLTINMTYRIDPDADPVAKLHHQIANSRKNFHFQTAHLLCDQADMIFAEDINFRVSAKGFFSKSMLDGAFG